MHPQGNTIMMNPDQAVSFFGHDWRELDGTVQVLDGFAVKVRTVSGIFGRMELTSTEGVNFEDVYS